MKTQSKHTHHKLCLDYCTMNAIATIRWKTTTSNSCTTITTTITTTTSFFCVFSLFLQSYSNWMCFLSNLLSHKPTQDRTDRFTAYDTINVQSKLDTVLHKLFQHSSWVTWPFSLLLSLNIWVTSLLMMSTMIKMCHVKWELCLHTNILARRFSSCSVPVKIVLFRTYCICFYGMELWQCYTRCSINRLRSSYIRCIKIFFNYPKYYSVTDMLLELGLPSFDTLLYNSRVRFANQVQCSQNSIIAQLRLILWFVFYS